MHHERQVQAIIAAAATSFVALEFKRDVELPHTCIPIEKTTTQDWGLLFYLSEDVPIFCDISRR